MNWGLFAENILRPDQTNGGGLFADEGRDEIEQPQQRPQQQPKRFGYGG